MLPRRVGFIALFFVAMLFVISFFFIPRIPQPLSYHKFRGPARLARHSKFRQFHF